MAKITEYATVGENASTFKIILEKHADEMIMKEMAEALKEVARHYVDQNMDKITAKLDIAGLGNLIAIYAARKLAQDAK